MSTLRPVSLLRALGERRKAIAVAGDEDEIMAAACQAIGIDGADAGGCAGHDGRAK